MIVRKASQRTLLCLRKAFGEVWQPLELWFTVETFSGTCTNMTFIEDTSAENLGILTTKNLMFAIEHLEKPDAYKKQVLLTNKERI